MAVLCIMLAVICLVDYCKMRIPNGMILLIFLYGLGYHYRDAGGQGAAEWLFNCTIVLVLTYPLFKNAEKSSFPIIWQNFYLFCCI